ncbi:type 1 fimbrial protein [Novosphingobium flavum]|uniref:Type 1 fimbrial protein n=1 Tax=Novosphingobium flavum TaxID=1778672 RepID=A0A7X1FUT9_9SPHN|nr:fimbrial protein [Novosphingobium flavum]MBC2666812.1 type 1 fimbrial protein [Novosphingobium flavum]
MKASSPYKFAAALLVFAYAPAAYASDGTITFSGAVTASTCTVKLNGGSASGTVTLPTVSTSALPSTGSTAGSTPFTLDISGCTFTGATAVTAYFEAGANVNGTTGRLTNTGGASNVELQLYLGSNYASKVAAGQSNQNAATPLTGNGQLRYGVEYYATGAATAGSVASTVTYSLIYS